MPIQWSFRRPTGGPGNAFRYPWVTPAPKIPVPLNNAYGNYDPTHPSMGPLGTRIMSYYAYNQQPDVTQGSFKSVVEGSNRVTY